MIAESRFFNDYSKSIGLITLIEGLFERSTDCGHFDLMNSCVSVFLKDMYKIKLKICINRAFAAVEIMKIAQLQNLIVGKVYIQSFCNFLWH